MLSVILVSNLSGKTVFSLSNLMSPAIPTGGAGVVLGGLIIFLLKLKGRRVSLLQLVMSAIAVFPLLGLLLHCPTADIAGITAAYPDG